MDMSNLINASLMGGYENVNLSSNLYSYSMPYTFTLEPTTLSTDAVNFPSGMPMQQFFAPTFVSLQSPEANHFTNLQLPQLQEEPAQTVNPYHNVVTAPDKSVKTKKPTKQRSPAKKQSRRSLEEQKLVEDMMYFNHLKELPEDFAT